MSGIKNKDYGFIQGIAWVLAILVRDHDEPSMAYEIMKSSGYNIAEMKRAGVDLLDLEPLKGMVKDEQVRRGHYRRWGHN